MINDAFPISRQALKSLRLITNLSDFGHFAAFFEALATVLPEVDSEVLAQCVDCFAVSPKSPLDQETALFGLKFLFDAITAEVCIEPICFAMSRLVQKIEPTAIDFGRELFERMFECYGRFDAGSAFLVIARLIDEAPDQLERFFGVVLAAQQRFTDPSILRPAVESVRILLDRFELNSFYPDLVPSLLACLQFGRSAGVKAAVLSALSTIVRKNPELRTSLTTNLLPSIHHMANSLRDIESFYGKRAGVLLAQLARLLAQLIDLGSVRARSAAILLFENMIDAPVIVGRVWRELIKLAAAVVRALGDDERMAGFLATIEQALRAAMIDENEIEAMMAGFAESQ
jgi:hypothetical protein